MERLLWKLSSSNDDDIITQVGIFAACFQSHFALPSFEEAAAQRLLNPDELIDSSAKHLDPGGNLYMLSELTSANELFKSEGYS